MTPVGYILVIKKKYLDSAAKKISRFDLEWGMWSAKMNRELRANSLDASESDQVKYKYSFCYWNILSELLELNFRYRFFKSKKKKELMEQAKDIEKMVTSKEPI